MPNATIEQMLTGAGEFPTVAWPGGYPLYYVCEDGGVLCPECANAEKELIFAAETDNDPQWNVIGYDINYEDDSLYCDHCCEQIESAYGDPESDG